METTTKELPLVQAADVQAAPLAALPAIAAAPPGPPPFPAPAAPASAPPVSPAARAPRRWPVAVAAWLGGVVAGMLLLTLTLGLFGGPRGVSASTGDPAATWDSSITLTDAYLTAQARKNGTGQVQEPTLRVQADGTLAMDGKISLLGRTVPLTAKLQPSLADGKLEMAIVSMQVGGLRLPELVVNQIRNGVASATQPPASALPTTIVKLEASEGKLVIYSKVK